METDLGRGETKRERAEKEKEGDIDMKDET